MSVVIKAKGFYVEANAHFRFWPKADIPSVSLTGTEIGDGVFLDNASYGHANPLPPALPLFATGLGALRLLGWRRKRKAQAVA